MHREALALLPLSHYGRSALLNNLSSALFTQFGRAGQLDDLEESVVVSRESVQTPQGDLDSCFFLKNLGSMLMAMYLHTHHSGHLEEAIAAFRAATAYESVSAWIRFDAASRWAHYADDANHESSLEAYRTAVQLLHRSRMHDLDPQAYRRSLISGNSGLACNAAASAIRSGLFDQAIEFLEQGRLIFWSPALQLRAPLDDLQIAVPELAQKLEGIIYAFKGIQTSSSDPSNEQQKAVHYRYLNEYWLKALEEVQGLDGFQNFLSTNRFATLQGAATSGPVVILNASESGCAALIVTMSGVEHIPLPDFTHSFAGVLVEMLRGVGSMLVMRAIRRVEPVASFDETLALVLAVLWLFVVKPVFRSLNLKARKFLSPEEFTLLTLNFILRKPSWRLHVYGGAPLDCSPAFPFTPLAYTIVPTPARAFSTMLYRLTHPRSRHFSLLCLLPATIST